MRKFLYATIMMASLVSISILAILAIGYMDPDNGRGLHPVAAGVLALIALGIGAMAAQELVCEEESLSDFEC